MPTRGRIHSVETLSGVDGPGPRCVVFLQGCPLRCLYCHNPDTWDTEAGTETTSQEVVDQIQRCRPYFGKQGGITLSGGEPLNQPDFAADILRRCKDNGIHTAIDTSGCCSRTALENVVPWLDLVLLDIKHTNPESFTALTGGRLADTMRTLTILSEYNIPVWVRQVIVPGWNDTEDDATRLGYMLRAFPNVKKLAFLPYHRMADNKWRQLGVTTPLLDTDPPAPEHVEYLLKRAENSRRTHALCS